MKDNKRYIKHLKKLSVGDSFEVSNGRHTRVSWMMRDSQQKLQKISNTVPSSPSCGNWMDANRLQLNRKFRELNIPTLIKSVTPKSMVMIAA